MSKSSKKDLKNINMILPNNLNEIQTNIDIILKKDEEIIKKYIERIIYTSKLPDNVTEQIDKVFQDVREHLL
jgi:hypothetical protein